MQTPHEKYLKTKEYYRLHPEKEAIKRAWAKKYLKNYVTPASTAYQIMVRVAKKAGCKLKITLEEFAEVYKIRDCYYCGDLIAGRSYHLDRLYPEKGYIKGNLVSCCWNCNQIKRKRNVKEFIAWIQVFAKKIKSLHP